MAAASTRQQAEVHFLPAPLEGQQLIAESRRLRVESWQLRLELLTMQCDLSLTIAAFGHANPDNQRTRRCCCATALIDLPGDEGWPIDQAAKRMAFTIPANPIVTPRTTPHQTEHPCEDLTHRELEVLKSIGEGYSTKQVAALLGMTFKTAACHRYRLMDKLNIHDTASLVRYAIRNDIVKA